MQLTIFLIKITFKVISLITLIYFLFFLTAILSGEYLYKKSIKNKMTFEMRPIELISLEEPFGIRKMLFILHTNTSFNYIYLRASKKKIIWSIINKEFIMKLIFLWFTGVGWLFIKIISKLIKIKQISLKEQIFIETCKSWTDKLLLIKNGKWVINGIKKEIIEEFEKLCFNNNITGKEKSQFLEEIKYLINNYSNNIKITDLRPLDIYYSKMINKDIGLHNTAIGFHKDDFYIGFLTDYKKAEINKWYGEEKMINKFMLKKSTTMLEIPKKELILVKPGMIVSRKSIIKGAIEDGYNPELLKEEDAYQIEISKNFDIELKTIIQSHDIDKSEFENLTNIILMDLTSHTPTK